MDNNIHIYKASAGSGKTYTVVQEYLKLLIATNSSSHREILATTFTNKATNEMKDRIISELKSLAITGESPYLDNLMKATRLGKRGVIERANRALKSILHDFSFFNVTTIDSFFQRIVRSFAYEVNLQAAFNTEVDDTVIKIEILEVLYQELDSKPYLKRWLMDYAKETINRGDKWNIDNKISGFIDELFNDIGIALKNDSEFCEFINNKENISQLVKDLRDQEEEMISTINNFGKSGLEMIESSGVDIDNFSNRGAAYTFLSNISKATIKSKIKDLAEKKSLLKVVNEHKWVKASVKNSSQKADIEQLFEGGLQDLLESAINYIHKVSYQLNTVKAIVSNFEMLGIVSDIFDIIKKISDQKNTMLLSDSNNLLKSINEGYDTAFIYEKIGNRIKHYMLDEFQDTSDNQWQNFLPLIEESASQLGETFIVGDLKQAIYRWRGGNSNILANEVSNHLGHFNLESITFDSNWRSEKNIVNFNNQFFDQVSINFKALWCDNPLSEIISTSYLKQAQIAKHSSDSNGVVNIELLDKKVYDDQSAEILDRMIETIYSILDAGHKASDISILVRGNAEANLIIEKILKEDNLNFVSADKLKLERSITVSFIIDTIRYLTKPSKTVLTTLLFNYYDKIVPLQKDHIQDLTRSYDNDWGLLFKGPSAKSEDFLKPDHDIPFIFDSYVENSKALLLSGSIIELIQMIVKDLYLNEIDSEIQFILTFIDQVTAQSNLGATDRFDLTEWWENKGKMISVVSEQTDDTMLISTIHKSKGLEYNFVLIPFCDWNIYPKPGSTFWATPENSSIELFNKIPQVPISIAEYLEDSAFQEQYVEKRIFDGLESINLLYVALTRAKKGLYVWCRDKGAASVSSLLHQIVPDLVNQGEIVKGESALWDEDNKRYRRGELIQNSDPAKESGANYLAKLNMGNREVVKFRKRNHIPFELSNDVTDCKLDHGIILHNIFEKILYIDDIDKVLNSYRLDGTISDKESSEIRNKIDEMLSNPMVKGWFDRSNKVLNERAILSPGNSIKRPDRVVIDGSKVYIIDYKTGVMKDELYSKQINGYIDLVKEMGYSDVTGWIWYIESNMIQKVS